MKLAIRSIYTARPNHYLISLDLAQAETWVVAHLANENNMKEALKSGDIHTKTAAEAIFFKPASEVTKEERYIGKQCNHALSYRMGHIQMARQINNRTAETGIAVTYAQCKEYRERWLKYYYLKTWWAEIEEKIKQTRQLTTVYGFRRTFHGFLDEELYKEATAFEPQSTVADHAVGAIHPKLGIPGGLIGIMKKFHNKLDCLVVNYTHDGVILDVPKSNYKDITEQCIELFQRPLVINDEMFTIPVDAEYGETWGEMVKYK